MVRLRTVFMLTFTQDVREETRVGEKVERSSMTQIAEAPRDLAAG